MNAVFLVGKAGKDPEIKYVGANNTAIASFSVATSRNQRSGNQDNWITTWHDIKCWGKTALLADTTIRKGDTVFVRGRIDVEEWEDKNGGGKRRKTVVVADSIVSQPKMNKDNSQSNDQEAAW